MMKIRIILIGCFVVIGMILISIYPDVRSSSQKYVEIYSNSEEFLSPTTDSVASLPVKKAKSKSAIFEISANSLRETDVIISRLNSDHISSDERKKLAKQIDSLVETRSLALEEELNDLIKKYDQLEINHRETLRKNRIEKP